MQQKNLWYWLCLFVLFIFWTLRVLFLPSPSSLELAGFLNNTSLRILFFLCPVLLVAVFVYKEPLRDTFALKMPTKIGVALAGIYSTVMLIIPLMNNTLAFSSNPLAYTNLLFAPIIEELVFRGFIMTHLLETTGKIRAILISSILFTLIHFPGWIFISGLKGESFITLTGQLFIFAIIQGIIRYYSKSIYPNIFVHMVNNLV